jgi:hypothetical protein
VSPKGADFTLDLVQILLSVSCAIVGFIGAFSETFGPEIAISVIGVLGCFFVARAIGSFLWPLQ